MDIETIAFGCVLAALLGVLARRDMRDMRLPNVWTGLLAACGLAQAALIQNPEPLEAVAAALLAAALLSFVLIVYRVWRGIDGLGLGDIKLAAAGAVWFGFAGVGPMLLVATAGAGAYVLLQTWRTGVFDAKARFPFGPFLALGIFASWLLTHALGPI